MQTQVIGRFPYGSRGSVKCCLGAGIASMGSGGRDGGRECGVGGWVDKHVGCVWGSTPNILACVFFSLFE